MSHMTTFSGQRFELMKPRPECMHLSDIAKSLSQQCRWLGHVKSHLSTAQHTVMVSYRSEAIAAEHGANKELQRRCGQAGFGHDWPETWLGDAITPFKHLPQMAWYRELEDEYLKVIGAKWNIPFFEPVVLTIWRQADFEILATESRDFREEDTEARRTLILNALPYPIIPMSAAEAHEVFMRRAVELGLA